MRLICSIAVAAVWFALAAPAAMAETNIGKGRLPIAYEPARPFKIGGRDEIVIEGVVRNRPATVVLRIDDRAGPSYRQRMNDERELAPGPFKLVFKAARLQTSGGRRLDLDRIWRLILFTTEGRPDVRISTFAIRLAGRRGGDKETISLGTGMAPITYAPNQVFSGRQSELIVEGRNKARETRTVLVRIDDQQSNHYSNRVNIERKLPPGEFSLRIAIDGLATPRKRVIDTDALRLIIVTPWPETRDIELTRLDLAPVRRLPNGAIALAFGAADAPLPPGFERVAPGDARIEGQFIKVRRRPNPDPLIANGMSGLTNVRLTTMPGRKRVTVWSEDPGEWEHLPQSLKRSITVNGRPLLRIDRRPSDWIRDRYLSQRYVEHDQASDVWTAFGRHRGNRHSIELESDGRLDIEIAGDSADERYLSGLLIEPAARSTALEQVIADRAQWYRSNAPLSPRNKEAYVPATAEAQEVSTYHLTRSLPAGSPDGERLQRMDKPVRARLAAGSGVRITLALTSDAAIQRPHIRLSPLKHASEQAELGLLVWAGLWRLDRVQPLDTQLALRDDRLVADLERLPLGPGRPRRYEIWLEAPLGTPVGRYSGHMDVGHDATIYRISFEVEVLDVELPAAAKPAGFYLGYAPHLLWPGHKRGDSVRQAACDMRFLVRLGLSGSAPPVSVPYRGGTTTFEQEMAAARNAGLAPGWLLYNPIHHLRDARGIERAAKFPAGANAAIARRGIAPPVWSAADEPSNPDQESSELSKWVEALRRNGGGSLRLGGHLNSPADRPFAELFDVAIINPSFGIDRAEIAKLRGSGPVVWLYNTFRPRLTAGYWLHSTRAMRYVQWHARMPTANPFDPLDGREGDVQVLYPDNRLCRPIPDIHRNLLRLAEGIVDQRWLTWLGAKQSRTAKRLALAQHNRLAKRWSEVHALDARQLGAWRDEIMDFAVSERVRQ